MKQLGHKKWVKRKKKLHKKRKLRRKKINVNHVKPIETILPYDELDNYPPIVYKYRTWADSFHKEIISEQVVFMAKPSSFEDPLDCKLQKRYDLLSEKDIFNYYLQDSKKTNPNWTKQQHRKFARDWTEKSPMKDKAHIKSMQAEHFEEFDSRFGVLSLGY